MSAIQEVFLEIEWGGEAEARQARDQRAAQLQEQGLVCSCENLYNVYGYRVFTLEATEATPIEVSPVPGRDAKQISLRGDRPISSRPPRESRPVRKFERR
ncbi:hypothetical protein H6G89_32605 [Oscillatoria sp. FACHB-1407]|uniref:hypothetical protein n=1 Tax=Oscillatoria sp. FACHB-1407 TaxID=2692847 RepID=UPI00168476DD|nr:hypothetical protein [Oscillatoria sp. FACHB-1407]MBD2465731.1 hypothetical protein [Oscillatoria sp. FACHB-1407]